MAINLTTFPMVYLALIIIIFASTCLAGPVQVDDNSSASPVTRWIQLYETIYKPSDVNNIISRSQLKSILIEMLVIEQKREFKSSLKSLIESRRFNINNFYYLFERSYESNLLLRRDNVTITDLLLQTFDHESNNCTQEYFKLLVDIISTFRHNPIAKALEENRQLQFKHCWHRLMRPVIASANLTLGSRALDPLEKLVLSTSPKANRLLQFRIDLSLAKYRKQSAWLAKYITKFLLNLSSKVDIDKFKRLIERPCASLVNETRAVTEDLLYLLKFTGYKKSYITAEHAFVLNRYLLCNRIIEDIEFIRLVVTKYENVAELDSASSSDTMHSAADDDHDEEEGYDDDVTMNSELMPPDPRLHMNYNLITQQPLSEQTILSNQQQQQQDRSIQLNAVDPNHPNAIVIRVVDTIGKGRQTKYLTMWSDGSETMEKKLYLLTYWPDRLKELLSKKAYDSRVRYEGRHRNDKKGEKSQLDQTDDVDEPAAKRQRLDPTSDIGETELGTDNTLADENIPTESRRKVVKIERTFGRGNSAKYLVVWSDNTMSLEKEPFLSSDYPDVLKSYRIHLRNRRQAAYNNRMAEKIARQRARLITLPHMTQLEPLPRQNPNSDQESNLDDKTKSS